VPAAIEFRNNICGGEEAIRQYCYDLAKTGGDRVSKILGTHSMDTSTRSMTNCCFTTVLLPLKFKQNGSKLAPGELSEEESGKIQQWLQRTAVKEFDTYLQIGFYGGQMWVRLSGQIYLELKNFEWVGFKLKALCARAQAGDAPW
jgi:hypothetical protein